MELRKACFLDRDGVIIEEENYLSDPGRVRLCHGAVEALIKLRKAGYILVVVSNQSGVARGMFSMKAVEAVQFRINKLLKSREASIDAWFNCPHHPEGKVPELAKECDCRKPRPGMILQAAKELSLDVSRSFMIGDKLCDVEVGRNAGCKAVALVRTGHGSEQDLSAPQLAGAVLAENVLDAVDKLLALDI